MASGLKGLDNVLANLHREVAKINDSGQAGVVEAALWVKGKAQRLTPVVTGNLQNSAFVVWPKGGQTNARFTGEDSDSMRSQHAGVVSETKARVAAKRQPVAAVGFSSAHARRTHENPRAGKTGGVSPRGKKYTPGLLPSGRRSTRKVYATSGQWKFLETPLKNTTTIRNIIVNRAKIK
jgi:hypothetical protein